MPVDNLQQLVARSLVATWGFGSELWAVTGLAATVLLIALALATFLPDQTLERWRASSWRSLLLSDGFFLAVAIAALIVLRLPVLSQLELNPDESGLILGARTLLHDPRFWISFENTTLGPLSTFAVVPPALIGMPVDYATIRIVGMFVWIAVLVLLFLGLRELYSPRLARILILPAMTTIIAFSYFDYVTFNGEHMAVLMLAAAFFLQVPLIRDVNSVRPGRSFLFGFALALVPLAKIQPGPLALAWGVIGLAHAMMYCRRRVGFILAGAVAPVALLAVYLLASGATYDFWQSYVLNNLLYAAVGWNATQQDVSFFENVLRAPEYFLKVPDSRGFVIFTGLLIVAVGAIATASRSFRQRLLRFDIVQGVLLVGLAIVCVLLPKNNWTHYLLLLVVPVTMLNAAAMATLFEGARERRLSIGVNLSEPAVAWTIRGTLFIAVCIAFFGAFAPTVFALKDGHPAMPEARKNLEDGRTPDPLTAAILRYAQPGDPVAHWGVFFVSLTRAGVSLGTRDVHIERAFYPSRQQQYYLDRFVADVLERRPRVLIDTNADPQFQVFRLENFPDQWHALAPHYEMVEDVDGNHIYTLRSEVAAAE